MKMNGESVWSPGPADSDGDALEKSEKSGHLLKAWPKAQTRKKEYREHSKTANGRVGRPAALAPSGEALRENKAGDGQTKKKTESQRDREVSREPCAQWRLEACPAGSH